MRSCQTRFLLIGDCLETLRLSDKLIWLTLIESFPLVYPSTRVIFATFRRVGSARPGLSSRIDAACLVWNNSDAQYDSFRSIRTQTLTAFARHKRTSFGRKWNFPASFEDRNDRNWVQGTRSAPFCAAQHDFAWVLRRCSQP